MSNVNETYRALENAVDAHVKNTNEDGVFVTGWAIVASLSSPSHDSGSSDGYVTYTSDGLPHHAQVGLLTIALDDKKNLGILAMISNAMSSDFDAFIEDDEEDEE
jgi:hypothetical protein